jgi:hypothetical protein
MAYRHGELLAVTVGAEPPIVAVIRHDDDNPLPHDSGFTILFTDAPDELPDPDDPCVRTVCLHCLIDQHPEAGRGLDLAGKHGEAELLNGTWT